MTTRLNLGCGEFPLSGFTNIDVYDGPGVDLVCNIVKLPHKDNSVDELFFGHCLEHLTMKEARKVLRECLRILKSGAKIGIVVPEKDLTPKHMIDGDQVEGKPYRGHHSYWSLDMLFKEAKEAGFEDVEKMNIDTYPHLVARPHWQVGITAIKGGKNMEEKEKTKKVPSPQEIELNRKLEKSYCKVCDKFVYNPTLKLHCPQCRRLL